MRPKLGLTRYRSGEVVLILKAINELVLFVIDIVAMSPFGLFKNTSSFSGETSYSVSAATYKTKNVIHLIKKRILKNIANKSRKKCFLFFWKKEKEKPLTKKKKDLKRKKKRENKDLRVEMTSNKDFKKYDQYNFLKLS